MVFHVFIFRVYLTFEKAVTLILKHAFLQLSDWSLPPEAALTNAELDYQKANIDVAIQQHLMASASEVSVEQFASFIMGTDIGFVYSSISHFYILSPFQLLNQGLKQSQISCIFGLTVEEYYKKDKLVQCCMVSIVTPCIVLTNKS
jgi:hypothetical protein